MKRVIGESCGRFQGQVWQTSLTAGHSQLAKTVIEAGEGSLPMTQKENETEFGEHVAFSLPQKVFPFGLS